MPGAGIGAGCGRFDGIGAGRSPCGGGVVTGRPGVGAWWMEGAKNSAIDENKDTERPIRLDIGHMQPIADAPTAPNATEPRRSCESCYCEPPDTS